MKKKYSTPICKVMVCLFSFISLSKSNAQLVIYLDSVKNLCLNDSSASISLHIKNFKNILELQGAIKWDPSVLKYNSINYGQENPIQLDSSMISVDTSNGYVLIAWSTSNILIPSTVADSTILLSVNFKVKNTESGSTSLYFTNYPALKDSIAMPLPLQIVDSPFNVITDTVFIPGYISFVSTPIVVQLDTSLVAIATGTPDSYQWSLDGTPISDQTGSTYINPTVIGGNYTVKVFYSDGCSVVSAPLPLPIVLKDFNGYYKAGEDEILWTTTSEINAAYFEIERSTNGTSFTTAGKVVASDNSSGSNYSFADAVTNAVDKFYYRLKMVDKNGAYSYSNVISIESSGDKSFSIYPNPVKSILSLKIQSDRMETVTVQVFDMIGRLVIQQSIPLDAGINNIPLNVATLARGSYILVVKGETQQQQGFIKY